MEERSTPDRYRLELGGEVHVIERDRYVRVLFELISRLLIDKEATRATFLLAADEPPLDETRAALFRHLRQQRCAGPDYDSLSGRAESFRLHSVVDALVAVHFFLGAGAAVPHFLVGHGKEDLVRCLDRGATTQALVTRPDLLDRLRDLIGPAGRGLPNSE